MAQVLKRHGMRMAWLLWLSLAGGTLDALSALSLPSGTEAGTPADTLRLLLQQADAEFADNVYPAAFADYRQALERMRHLPAGHAAAEAYSQVYLRLGQSCYFMGKYAEGIHYLYELLEKHVPDTVFKTESYILLGNLYLRLQKDSTALRHLAEARELLDAASPRMNDSTEAELYPKSFIRLCLISVLVASVFFMAFFAGIAGYVKRKGVKKRRHKTESGQRYSPDGLMTDLGLLQPVHLLCVYATGGQLQAQSTTQFTFATGTWPQGVYLVQVVQGGQTRMHKVAVR